MKLIVVTALLFFSPFAYATISWEQTCASVKDLAMPASDLPPATVAVADKCDAEALYYGIGAKVDFIAARYCAIKQVKEELVFGGNAILMMIYANGAGVARNFDLAIHYACLVDGAPAEVQGRIEHLSELKEKKWEGNDFDLCDDITSGFMGGHCAAHKARMESVKRDQRFAAVAAKVPSGQKALLDTLKAASDGFIKARVDNEVDLSGTARSSFQIQEEKILNEDFVQMLEAYAKGKGHSYSENKAKELDEKMAKALAAIRATSAGQQKGWGTITSQGIDVAQKAWEGYRDAFAAYASARDKKVKPSSVKGWLTAKRIHMLKSWH